VGRFQNNSLRLQYWCWLAKENFHWQMMREPVEYCQSRLGQGVASDLKKINGDELKARE